MDAAPRFIQGLYNPTADKEDFAAQPSQPLKLSKLRGIYKDRRTFGSAPAARLLQNINQFTVTPDDASDRIFFNDPMQNVSFSIPDQHLDYLFAFPKYAGLDVLRPPRGTDRPHDWIFSLRLNQPLSALRTKHGLVGFDPTRAVLLIGQQGIDHIWLAMCLKTDLDKQGSAYPAGHSFTDPTTMSRPHLRIVVGYLLLCLAEAGIQGIIINKQSLFAISLDANTSVNWDQVMNGTFKYVLFLSSAFFDPILSDH